MVVLLSILLRLFRNMFRKFRAAGKGHTDDLSKDEFFDQQRCGQRERQTADDRPALAASFP